MMNQGDKNKAFLASLDLVTSKQIVDSIVEHYGSYFDRIMNDITDEDAECILEYIADEPLRRATSLLYHAFTMRTWRDDNAKFAM